MSGRCCFQGKVQLTEIEEEGGVEGVEGDDGGDAVDGDPAAAVSEGE